MNLEEDYNYNIKEFKKKTGFKTDDMENLFITEEMILGSLYSKIKIDKNLKTYKFFPLDDVRVECYCKECNKRRIFAFENSKIAFDSLLCCSLGSGDDNSIYHKLSDIDFFSLCAQADCNHKMIILFMKVDRETIMKVGQFPSIYDLDENINNKKFLKVLGKEYADYYKRACSLYSFSTYIGALVYLRRIFEKLLLDVFNTYSAELKIDLEDFQRERMEDKIKTLKSYLPSIMFEQGFNKIYTKISNGIHNLSEEECSKMFLVLKMGIEEILTEKMESEEKDKRIKELSKELEGI